MTDLAQRPALTTGDGADAVPSLDHGGAAAAPVAPAHEQAPRSSVDELAESDAYWDDAARTYAHLPDGAQEGIAHATVEQWLDEDTAAGVLPSWSDLATSDLYDTPIPFTAPAWLTAARAEEYDDYDAEIPFHVVDDYTRHMTSDTGDADGHGL